MHHSCRSRERVCANKSENTDQNSNSEKRTAESVARTTMESPPRQSEESTNSSAIKNGFYSNDASRSLLKSASISASKCVVVKSKRDSEVSNLLHEI